MIDQREGPAHPVAASLSSRIADTLSRRVNILSCRHLSLSDRIRAVMHYHPEINKAVNQLIHEEGNLLSIDIGGFRFEAQAPPGASDRQIRREFFAQIIGESFVDPLLYWGPVTPRPGDVVLDLGANIGTTAAVFAERVGPGGKVFAFEPCVVDELQGNILRNGLKNVEIVPVAVSDHVGEVEMTFGVSAIDSSTVLHPEWHHGRKMVPAETLDHFVESRGLDRVDFIKVDIEGAEELAIRGATKLVERFRPSWSISSYHRDMSGEFQHPKLVALLGEMGYQIRQVQRYHIFAYDQRRRIARDH